MLCFYAFVVTYRLPPISPMLISSFKGKGVLLCENVSPCLPVRAIYYSLAFYDNLALYNSLALYYNLALHYNLALYYNLGLYSSLSKPQSSHQTSVISSNLSNSAFYGVRACIPKALYT